MLVSEAKPGYFESEMVANPWTEIQTTTTTTTTTTTKQQQQQQQQQKQRYNDTLFTRGKYDGAWFNTSQSHTFHTIKLKLCNEEESPVSYERDEPSPI